MIVGMTRLNVSCYIECVCYERKGAYAVASAAHHPVVFVKGASRMMKGHNVGLPPQMTLNQILHQMSLTPHTCHHFCD